jgi:hypothetical protein
VAVAEESCRYVAVADELVRYVTAKLFPWSVTLEAFIWIKDDVSPWSDPTNVLESKTTFDVGLETMTDLLADPVETARADAPPAPGD